MSEPKNSTFKFNPKVQKKIMDKKKNDGFSGIMGLQSFEKAATHIKHSEPEQTRVQEVEYKLPTWFTVSVSEAPIS